jgi:uncharacterized OB-fold protein
VAKLIGINGYSCPKCGWSDLVQVKVCPVCQSSVDQTQFSKHGKIATFTVIRYPPLGFEKDSPYLIALIALEKGPKVIGRVIENLKNAKIGQAVTFAREMKGALVFTAKR